MYSVSVIIENQFCYFVTLLPFCNEPICIEHPLLILCLCYTTLTSSGHREICAQPLRNRFPTVS